MREKINVFYYPDFWVDYATLIKSILFFDELHFMDRPSMMFDTVTGQYGTIGAASPLRSYEASFREQGVPLYVHGAPMGPVYGDWQEQIKADVNDLEFLRRFQDGLKTSTTFRSIQIAHGNYGEAGDQDAVAQKLMAVDLSKDLQNYESAMALFETSKVRPFDLATPEGCARQFISAALTCSAKLNFALNVGAKEGFFPLSDASPYGNLLGTKYSRAIRKLEPAGNRIQVTDLSFAIFDELIATERLRELKLTDAIAYRKKSAGAREEFLDHLGVIQARQANLRLDGDYAAAIRQLVMAEVVPAAKTFKSKMQSIDEALFGAVAKGVIGAVGGSSAITLFGDLSWPKIIGLASAAAAYVANVAIDAILAERAARRECSISYVLALE